ncbi:MAG: hypothetical protein EPO21_22740 [Chloroflexota bacterium]|nr:MAG: hypothetical protein EPO21_22740 [Chloroflexota bacterium]
MPDIREDEHMRKMKEPVRRENLRFGIDIDGTITQAPRHFQRLIDALMKTGNHVYIVTGRDESRRTETELFLAGCGIRYDEMMMRPVDWAETIPDYKVKIVREHDLHMLIDDDEANCWAIQLQTQALAAHMLPIPELPEEMVALLDGEM